MRTMQWLVLLGLLGACGEVLEPTTTEPPALTDEVERDALEVRSFGDNPGDVRLFLYAPTQPKAGAGLVVALHGCLQTAADFQKVGWNRLAETHGFYVLYAQASTANGCFRWFDPAHASRGQGESASVVGGVDWVLRRYAVDRRKVSVTGLSAGAAMSAAMLASSPDVFSAGALFAGVPAGCATSALTGMECMAGVDLLPATWAARVQAKWPVTPEQAPRVQIWTGADDTTVRPTMARELVEQWTTLNGLDTEADRIEAVGRVTSEEHRRDGETRVQLLSVNDFGHAVPVSATRGCGAVGPFVQEAGVCGASEAARFFGLLDAVDTEPVVESLDAGVMSPGEPTPDAGTPPLSPDAGLPTCREAVATPTWHLWLRRGEVCGFFRTLVCGTGSGELLGSTASVLPVTAWSAGDGVWRAGACP